MLTQKLFSLKYLFFIAILSSSHVLFAQKQCGVVLYNEHLQLLKPNHESQEEFELWIKSKQNSRRLNIEKTTSKKAEKDASPYVIPVVFHILHKGEAIGTGANISMERIQYQMDVMNADFRRKNEDSSNTPSEFISISADANIEFVLAKRDPDGLPTTGVVRKISTKNSYTQFEAEIIASQSYWPAEEYFNIWVIEISGAIGFAKYPVSDLNGLFEKNMDRMVDGIYIDHHYLGDNSIKLEKRTYLSTGRTVTHETGHWLSLRHIWGDGPCGADDYCDDTPTQSGPIYGCPVFGEEVSCGTNDMFQNYMDYSDDICMNLFTKCQADRMQMVLEFSPRRKSLLTSPALKLPDQFSNDLGIKQIVTPHLGHCGQQVTPTIEVLNYGTNNIQSFEIELLVNDVSKEILSISKLLMPYESLIVAFSNIVTENISTGLSFKIKSTNAIDDGNGLNDCRWINPTFPKETTIPIFQNFEDPTEQILNIWSVRNFDSNTSQWELVNAPDVELDNTAIRLNNYNSTQYGQLDYLISPVFNLIGVVTADIKFRYAYAPYAGKYMDALKILVSTDCGATFPEENKLFELWSPELATTAYTNQAFVPEGTGSWRDVEINFGEYANEENVVIAFVANHGGGNHIYLDQIEISTNNVSNFDISLKSINQVPAVTCHDSLIPVLEVKNLGLQTLNSFDITYTLNDQIKTIQKSGLNILPGKSLEISLPVTSISNGKQNLLVDIQNPNGQQDENMSNGRKSISFEINTKEDAIPYKEKFTNSSSYKNWSFFRQDNETNWEIYDWGNFDKSAMAKGYGNSDLNAKNWLVSPSLDFSTVTAASLKFDLSYAFKEGRNDQLQILVSTNCGQSYTETIYDKSGSKLSDNSIVTEWFPSKIVDWKREYIDLTAFVGNKSVRVAFVVTNQNGNNLFLDNIEFFDTINPIDIITNKTIAVFPNPAKNSFEIKFNFNIKEEVKIRLVSLTGEVMAEQSFPNTLNQLYKVENLNVRNGIYLLHVLGQSTNLTEKIIIAN